MAFCVSSLDIIQIIEQCYHPSSSQWIGTACSGKYLMDEQKTTPLIDDYHNSSELWNNKFAEYKDIIIKYDKWNNNYRVIIIFGLLIKK